MNNITISFILTLIAGFSTLIGTFLIFLKVKNYHKLIAGSLSFAAAIMITISITDLVPESLISLKSFFENDFSIIICLIFIILGIILSMIMNYFLPNTTDNVTNNNLFKVGIISMLAIILHNIPEGMITFITANNNIELGISLTIAIALHNIPEGISISIPIYYATKSKIKAIGYTLISALSEPFGAIITYLFLFNYVNDLIIGILFAIISGIMLHISFCELLPTSKSYNLPKYTKTFFLIGVIFMIIQFVI